MRSVLFCVCVFFFSVLRIVSFIWGGSVFVIMLCFWVVFVVVRWLFAVFSKGLCCSVCLFEISYGWFFGEWFWMVFDLTSIFLWMKPSTLFP